MNDAEFDESDLLRRELRLIGLPGPAEPEDSGLAFRSAGTFFETETETETETTTKGARFRARTWLSPLAVAAAVIGIAVLAPGAQVEDVPTPSVPTVSPEVVTLASTLREAADSSAVAPDQSDARFWRVESVQQQGTAPAETRVVWLGRREPGLVVDDFGRAVLPPALFGLQKTLLTWEELLDLPTDPVRLRAMFDEEVEGLSNPDLAVAKLAAGLLAESPAPPEVREALWRVIAGVRGTRFLGNVTDALGRAGIGFALGTPETETAEYVIDPEAGRLLQARTKSSRAGADQFQVTYLEQGPASTLPAS